MELPPFFGGAVGYLGYDLVHFIEELPRTTEDDQALPDLYMAFVETVIAIDHAEKMLYLIFCPNRERFHGSDPRRLYLQAEEKLRMIESRLINAPDSYPAPLDPGPTSPHPLVASLSREEYIRQVEKCRDYIHQGDIFQANLSVRFSADGQSTPPLARD